MARRIRSIKPEVLEDEVVATLPHREWRLFVSLWVLADDYGNLRGTVAFIRASVMWGAPEETDASIQEALSALITKDLLVSYIVRGQPYLHIGGWSKHQKVDKPGKPSVPSPDEARESSRTFAKDSATPPTPRENPGDGLDLDLEGKGEEREAPVSISGIGTLVQEARASLNEARKRIDPDARELEPFHGERDLFDRLRDTPEGERAPRLRHCLSVLIARAERRRSVTDLRLAYLGGEKAWPALLADTVASARGRDGPGGHATKKHAPMLPILKPKPPDGDDST